MSIREEAYDLLEKMLSTENDIDNLRQMALSLLKMIKEVEDLVTSAVEESKKEKAKEENASESGFPSTFDPWFNSK